jgi:hypothetical protein
MILKYKDAYGGKKYRPVVFGRPTARAFSTRTACEKYRDRFIRKYMSLIPYSVEVIDPRPTYSLLERFVMWCRDIMGWA